MDILPFSRSYWVIPGVFLAGEIPCSLDREECLHKLENLSATGIKRVINLMEPDETNRDGMSFLDYFPLVNEKGVETERFPIRDLGVPKVSEMQKILDSIDEDIKIRKPVYVHCWGGLGRTGTVVGCFLMRHRYCAGDNVLSMIDHLRRTTPTARLQSPETPQQRQYVKDWRPGL